MKIGIIVGSTRDSRVGRRVADWVMQQAEGRTEASYELVDLADYNLPLLSTATPPGALNRQYEEPEIRAWGKKIDELDGFIFVTPEYNHGVPAAMKNAFDVIGPEWIKKAVAFVAYGADGGVRAVENWRVVVANYNVYDIRNALALSLFTDFGADGFAPQDRRLAELSDLFETLEPAVKAMATLR